MSDFEECPDCEGTGYITWFEDYWRGGHQTREKCAECETCEGEGEVVDG